jgi:hypothetical protein
MFTMAREGGSGESKILVVWAISHHDRFHSHKTPAPFHPKTRLSQRGGQALHDGAESRFPPSRQLEWTLPAPSGQPPRHAPAQAVHVVLQIGGLQRFFARHKEYTRRVSGDAGKPTNAVFSPYLYRSGQWQWAPPRHPKSPLLVRISSKGPIGQTSFSGGGAFEPATSSAGPRRACEARMVAKI